MAIVSHARSGSDHAAASASRHHVRRRVRLLLAVLAVAVLVGLALPGALMYRRLHPPRTSLDDDPGRHGLAYTDVAFTSPLDGTTLRGWYLPTPHPTGRALVIAPGIDADRRVDGITLRLAPALLDAGFDVLAFDLRAEGASEGDMQTFGAREQADVLGAVAEARRRGARSVGVLGFSLGAASALLAAARSPSVDAVVADSAFADLRDTLIHELTVDDHLPMPIAEYGVAWFRPLSGVDPAGIAPANVMAALHGRCVLLIQGGTDRTVPPADSERLVAASGGAAERWLVPGGGHATSYLSDPAGYTARVLEFFQRSLH